MGVSAAERFLLRRPALEERLDESFGRRLTLLVAGAGYGKSTLVAQWADELESAWYTVSTQDRRLSSFAAGIAGALRSQVGELPEESLAALAGGGDELVRAEVVAGHFSQRLGSSLTHDLVLVLDDAQEVASSASSLRLIESLCRQAPGTFHLVVLSREALDLRVDRLRAQGEVIELTSADLAFSSAEVGELSQVLLRENGELAARIHRATGGWPAAVRLTLEALTRVPADEQRQTLDRLSRPGTPLFSYLAHEVFERESPDVQELIRTVAPLQRFTLELCDALGVRRAADTIDELVKRGLFVQQHGDTFALHALAREFARSAWPLAVEEERAVHVQAGGWFESEGRMDDALHEFSAASQDREVARILAAHGESMLTAGEAETVVALATPLPVELKGAEIEQLLGEALFMRGDFDAAIAAYERSAERAGSVGPGLAWRLGAAHHFRGDLDTALASYARAAPKRGDGPDGAILLGWAASAHWLRGDFDEARTLASRSLEIARPSGDDRALAAASVAAAAVCFEDGRFPEGDDLLRSALEAAERCRDLVQLGRIRVNRASAMTDRGAYRLALAEVDEAFALSEFFGLDFPGRALLNRGGIHVRLGLLDEAHADYATVVERSLNSEIVSAGRHYGYLGLGDVHRERGNVALARAAYEQGLRLGEGGREFYGLATGLQGLARVLVDEDPAEASRVAERAARQRLAFRALALNAMGWVALALRAREDAAAAAVEATRLARERNDAYALAEALELGVFAGEEPTAGIARLEEALAIWRDLDSRVRVAGCELALARLSAGPEGQAAQDRALRKLRALGVRVSAAGPAGLLRFVAQPTPAAVAIEVLGGFRVLREGVPVPLSSWQSKRARDLLKILVSRRGRPVPREVLMEELWPGAEATKLANRLSVSLSTLRSVLDPESRFDAEHFVKADRESVKLDLGAVLVDVEVFLHEAETGLSLRADGQIREAAEWLGQAESAYAGDVLEDDPYTDWAISLREDARAAYHSVTDALARDAAATGDDNAAARYFLRIVGHDPYAEEAHLGLVSALERSGRRGGARRAYRSYVARMEEIGATPATFPNDAVL